MRARGEPLGERAVGEDAHERVGERRRDRRRRRAARRRRRRRGSGSSPHACRRRRDRGRTPRRARGPCPPSATAGRAPRRRPSRPRPPPASSCAVPANAVVADERLGDVGARPRADEAERAPTEPSARPGATPPRGRRCSCTARARRRRAPTGCVGQRRRRDRERLEIHERRKVGGRLDAELADESRRERRDGAHGVGAAERRTPRPRRRAGRAAGAPPSRRGASTCASRRAPRRRCARARARAGARRARPRRRRRSGRRRRPGRNVRSSPRDPRRQREPEARRRRTTRGRNGRDERERRVPGRRHRRRGREHAHVELAAERVELAREARRERQPVAGPADEEDAWLAHGARVRATRSSVCSSSAKTRSGAYLATDAAAALAEAAPQARRRRRSGGSASAERASVAERNEQPVLAVGHDLGDAAGRRREHRRADGERLDDRVREVLPARREDRRVGGGEELDDALARQRTEEAHALAEPELGDIALEPRRARRRRPRSGARPPSTLATASSATRSDFCAVSRPANASVGPVSSKRCRSSSRGGSTGSGGVGFGSTDTRLASTPQPSASSRR